MPSKISFARQETNWFALIPELILLAILCACFYPLDKKDYGSLASIIGLQTKSQVQQLLGQRLGSILGAGNTGPNAAGTSNNKYRVHNRKYNNWKTK